VSDGVVRTVGALLVDAQGRVLLGLRAPHKKAWPDHWNAIGGRVEAGETSDQALIREVREEVGVVPLSFKRLASVPEPRPDLYGYSVATLYAVTSWEGGEPRNACDEHVRLEWFSEEQLAALEGLAGYDYPHFARLARELKRASSDW
jgi:8-oxo-dGTP pyrophosphatase MutT (NUDIX family)